MFSVVPGSENESNTKLEDLENFAPSPLIFTRTLAAFSRSGTYMYIYTYILFERTYNYNIIHVRTHLLQLTTCRRALVNVSFKLRYAPPPTEMTSTSVFSLLCNPFTTWLRCRVGLTYYMYIIILHGIIVIKSQHPT